jgi:hypothetical protein
LNIYFFRHISGCLYCCHSSQRETPYHQGERGRKQRATVTHPPHGQSRFHGCFCSPPSLISQPASRCVGQSTSHMALSTPIVPITSQSSARAKRRSGVPQVPRVELRQSLLPSQEEPSTRMMSLCCICLLYATLP